MEYKCSVVCDEVYIVTNFSESFIVRRVDDITKSCETVLHLLFLAFFFNQ